MKKRTQKILFFFVIVCLIIYIFRSKTYETYDDSNPRGSKWGHVDDAVPDTDWTMGMEKYETYDDSNPRGSKWGHVDDAVPDTDPDTGWTMGMEK